MPRTDIPVINIAENNKAAVVITTIAGDAANDHSFKNDGRTLLHVNNAGGAGITATVKGVADENGRLLDQTVAVGVGLIGVIGPFRTAGFNQPTTGVVNVDLDTDASVTVTALRYKG